MTVLSASFQFYGDYRSEMESLNASLAEIEETHLPTLSLSVFNFEIDRARLLLEGLLLSRNLAYAEVEELRGDEYVSILSVGAGVPERPLQRTLPLEVNYSGSVREIGRLHVYADLALVREGLTERAWRLVASNAAQVFAVALLMLLIVQRAVVRHLRKTSDFLASVQLPQADALVLNRRHRGASATDELDDIARAINDMTDRISDTYHELAQTRDRLQSSLSEKEMLLRELYHRTKNNMQVIISMLSLQADETSSVEELVVGTRGRINAMALVHEKLYQSSDLSRIHMPEYLTELTAYIADAHTDNRANVQIDVNAEELSLLFDTAVACGLIVNELVTNAIEHAFPGAARADAGRARRVYEQPHITVSLARSGEEALHLQVSDNGVGLPDGFDPRTNGRMGLEAVYAIGEHQLGGVVSYRSENGLTFDISFPDSMYQERV